jgi:hypothetical protein
MEVVIGIEGAKAPARPQRIGHEVGRLGAIGRLRNRLRLADARWKSALATSRKAEIHYDIDSPTACFPETCETQRSVEQQAKMVPGVVVHMALNRHYEQAVVGRFGHAVTRRT